MDTRQDIRVYLISRPYITEWDKFPGYSINPCFYLETHIPCYEYRFSLMCKWSYDNFPFSGTFSGSLFYSKWQQ